MRRFGALHIAFQACENSVNSHQLDDSRTRVMSPIKNSPVDLIKWSLLVSMTAADDESWTVANTDKTCGRGVYATRPIAAGELIFEETPLLTGPIASDERAASHCVGCNLPLSTGQRQMCPRNCGLPLCGPSCAQIQQHRRECTLIRSWRMTTLSDAPQVNVKLLQLLAAIRGLFLDQDRLRLLEAMQANRLDSTNAWVEKICIEQFAEPFASLAFLQRTVAVLNTNAFEVATQHLSIKGLYALAGQLNHNCVPNTRHEVRSPSDDATSVYRMQMYACRPIKAGEQITTNYTRLLWDTASRRMHLHRTKQFWCDCQRCADATELGTFLGALRCQRTACAGRLVAVAPLVERSAWRCDVCAQLLDHAKVCQVNTIVMGILQKDTWEGVSSVWTIAEEQRLLRRLVFASNKAVVEFKLQKLWEEQVTGRGL